MSRWFLSSENYVDPNTLDDNAKTPLTVPLSKYHGHGQYARDRYPLLRSAFG